MKTRTIFTALMLILSIAAIAQRSVFDDDIYYTPKTKKAVKEEPKIEEPTIPVITSTNQTSSQNNIDVDAYNRRYTSSNTTETDTQDTLPQTVTTQAYYVNGVGGEGMEYAERIRRFHNPEIGIYVVDPEYNNIYLIEEDYTPYITSINVITSPWSWGITYNPWYYNPWYYNSWYCNAWSYNPWYWTTAYNPYYPSYYPPRPYPGYRPKPAPLPSHHPDYKPTPNRPASNHGQRYTPGGSVGTGGRTDGAVRYNGATSPSRGNQSVSPNSGNRPSNRTTPSYGGRTSSGSSNKGTSSNGGSFERPSYSKPATTAPSRQSYSPSNIGGNRTTTHSSGRSSGGGSVGGRGSR